MDKELIKKICLGTAQFGLDYGIANIKGKIAKEEAFNILNYASSIGIELLDTAYGYGDSENVIGEFNESGKSTFKVVTKLPSLKVSDINTIRNTLTESLRRLQTKKIYALLVHDFKNFSENPLLWDVVIGFKHERFAENIGFSIYKTDELESIFEKNIHFDVIQLPYSIFDRRFERYFLRLKERGVIILVRSIFLQGLAFLNPDTLDGNLFKARGHLSKLNGLSSDTGIPINALCLDFALLNPKIDRVVIGVDSLEHLRKNIEDLSFVNEVRNIYDKLDVFSIDEEDIILPYRWDKG